MDDHDKGLLIIFIGISIFLLAAYIGDDFQILLYLVGGIIIRRGMKYL